MGMNYGGAKRRAAKFTVVFVGRLVVGLLAPNATCCVWKTNCCSAFQPWPCVPSITEATAHICSAFIVVLQCIREPHNNDRDHTLIPIASCEPALGSRQYAAHYNVWIVSSVSPIRKEEEGLFYGSCWPREINMMMKTTEHWHRLASTRPTPFLDGRRCLSVERIEWQDSWPHQDDWMCLINLIHFGFHSDFFYWIPLRFLSRQVVPSNINYFWINYVIENTYLIEANSIVAHPIPRYYDLVPH